MKVFFENIRQNWIRTELRPYCSLVFSARQHCMLSALCNCPSVRQSVCPSHGWISQKRL